MYTFNDLIAHFEDIDSVYNALIRVKEEKRIGEWTLNTHFISLRSCLMHSFDWYNDPKGPDFWSNVWLTIVEDKPLQSPSILRSEGERGPDTHPHFHPFSPTAS